jgi:site-specific recombinase XerD
MNLTTRAGESIVAKVITAASVGDLGTLIPIFLRSLRAQNKSPKTIQVYGESANQFVRFLKDQGMPTLASAVTREHVEAFVELLLATKSPATASVRYRSLQSLFKYLSEELGEIAVNPMLRMKPPKIPESPPPVMADDTLKALRKACAGRAFDDVRDLAIINVLIDTGCRASEVIGLRIDPKDPNVVVDVNMDEGLLRVTGKGSKTRFVSIGLTTTNALDRYLLARARHPMAARTDALWLGLRGPTTVSGLRDILERRSRLAGLPHPINPHAFRHKFSHDYLAKGGQESNLMSLNGWKTREMINRYGASAASERAIQEHKRLSPGDRL